MRSNLFDSSDGNFQKLLRALRKDSSSVVPFIGAGLSAYGVDNDRLPTWPELLKGLLAYAFEQDCLDVEEHDAILHNIETGDLIPSTGKLLQSMGVPHFMRYIRSRLDASDSELSPGMLNLVSIAWSIIVTTNLDNVIELSFEQLHGRSIPVITNRQQAELSETIARGPYQGATVLAKIHGSIDDYSSWVLAPEHYDRLMTNQTYVEILRQLFTKQLFFVGYGLRDGDFDIVQDYLGHIYPEGLGEFYALIPGYLRGNSVVRSLVRKRCLAPIYYEVQDPPDADDPWGGHGAVGECLSILATEWSKGADSLPVILKAFYDLEDDIWVREQETNILSKVLLDAQSSVQVTGYGGEGKTTFVQHWIQNNRSKLSNAGFDIVYGFSFYLASVDRFVEQAYLSLCSDGSGSRDLSARISELCRLLSTKKVLLFLDGLEVVLDRHGQVKNLYLRKVLDSIHGTSSCVVITTRIPCDGPYVGLPLNPLSTDDALRMARRFGVEDLHPSLMDRFVRRTGGHALSIRFGSTIAHVKEDAETNEVVDEPAKETSVLYANKIRKTLGFYESVLSEEQIAFLSCFSIFRSPTSFQTIEAILQTSYVDWDGNTSLIDLDLRVVVLGLREMRLVILTQGSYLTMHPNVRDYFSSQNTDMTVLHAGVARWLIERLPKEEPDTFEECQPFLDACYHAARGGLWTEFHYLFVYRINREFRNHLGNSIGAWNEYRSTALLAFPNDDANQVPTIFPEYYSQVNARCLKHLGESTAAEQAYPVALRFSALKNEPETAKYINNYLTLVICTGGLDLALQIAPWNFATLSWIEEEWREAWQVEHGAYSIAWLAYLRGDLATSSKLFSIGESAWYSTSQERIEVFDYFPIYHTEALLNHRRPQTSKAFNLAERYLSAGRRNSWPETQVRAHIALSQIGRFANRGKNTSRLEECAKHLDKADEICAKVLIPPAEVELNLERVRLNLDTVEHSREKPDTTPLTKDVARVKKLIDQLGWNLFLPEVMALEGRLAFLTENFDLAVEHYRHGVSLANEQSNVAARLSKIQSLDRLRNSLGEKQDGEFTAYAWRYSHLAKTKYKSPSAEYLVDAISKNFSIRPR